MLGYSEYEIVQIPSAIMKAKTLFYPLISILFLFYLFVFQLLIPFLPQSGSAANIQIYFNTTTFFTPKQVKFPRQTRQKYDILPLFN